MKTNNVISGKQIKELALLIVNNTNFFQTKKLFFVQLNDEHSVDNTGAIFQIADKESAGEVARKSNALQYEGEVSGIIYNYAEDSTKFFKEDDLKAYNHCKQQAELLFDDLTNNY